MHLRRQSFYLPQTSKYRVVPYGYRDSSVGVGSRGFPIFIKPSLSMNSKPINIKIRIQRTKKGFDISAKEVLN